MKQYKKQLRIIRWWIAFFMVALAISGVTASFVEAELRWLLHLFDADTTIGIWLDRVYSGIHQTNTEFPFIAYGFDWLAFGHIIIAAFFIGPYKDPIGNRWVLKVAVFACLAVFPVAIIAGHLRGIPPLWQMIDCSFGVFGLIPLYLLNQKIIALEALKVSSPL